MDHRRKKLIVKSVLNFRRVTQYWLCMLGTQVTNAKEQNNRKSQCLQKRGSKLVLSLLELIKGRGFAVFAHK